jgi:hypothetical protein
METSSGSEDKCGTVMIECRTVVIECGTVTITSTERKSDKEMCATDQ